MLVMSVVRARAEWLGSKGCPESLLHTGGSRLCGCKMLNRPELSTVKGGKQYAGRETALYCSDLKRVSLAALAAAATRGAAEKSTE